MKPQILKAYCTSISDNYVVILPEGGTFGLCADEMRRLSVPFRELKVDCIDDVVTMLTSTGEVVILDKKNPSSQYLFEVFYTIPWGEVEGIKLTKPTSELAERARLEYLSLL